MRVLGVDPGLTRCGLGVVEQGPYRRLRLVDVTVMRTGPEEELGARLLRVEQGLAACLDAYAPEAVAIERVFSQHNVRTVMGTAQVSGVVLAAAAGRGLPIALHTPSEVKAAVTGNGRADKDQVMRMVARVLGLSEPPRPADAADALALAICYLWRGVATARWAAGTNGSGAPSRWAAAVRARGRPAVTARPAIGGRARPEAKGAAR